MLLGTIIKSILWWSKKLFSQTMTRTSADYIYPPDIIYILSLWGDKTLRGVITKVYFKGCTNKMFSKLKFPKGNAGPILNKVEEGILVFQRFFFSFFFFLSLLSLSAYIKMSKYRNYIHWKQEKGKKLLENRYTSTTIMSLGLKS